MRRGGSEERGESKEREGSEERGEVRRGEK